MDQEHPEDIRRRAESLLDALTYDELRAIAGRVALSGRWIDRDPTSLLHDALTNWMRRGRSHGPAADRDAVIASMVTVIRNAAIDRARRRNAASRPSPVDPAILDDGPAVEPGGVDHDTLVALSAAIDELRSRAPRAAVALELRIHGGLEVADIAGALGVSLAQAKRDIMAAKAFVRSRLEPGAGGGSP